MPIGKTRAMAALDMPSNLATPLLLRPIVLWPGVLSSGLTVIVSSLVIIDAFLSWINENGAIALRRTSMALLLASNRTIIDRSSNGVKTPRNVFIWQKKLADKS